MSAEVHRIVRERIFVESRLEDLMVLLRLERATGTLTIEVNQGGIRAVHFREEAPIEAAANYFLDKASMP